MATLDSKVIILRPALRSSRTVPLLGVLQTVTIISKSDHEAVGYRHAAILGDEGVKVI